MTERSVINDGKSDRLRQTEEEDRLEKLTKAAGCYDLQVRVEVCLHEGKKWNGNGGGGGGGG